MFWRYNNASSSQIETVLAKENVTLQELLNEEDIISECKLQNKTLIDYLIKPNIIDELVTLITTEPSSEVEEHIRFKYPNIACEILTCDVPALNERLASDENLLAKLYAFLDCEPPLNPLLASFFSKVMGVLIAKKTEQVLEFLKAKENFVSILLKHMGTSAIMDLTVKLMTQMDGVDVRSNILNWLNSQQLIQLLVGLLNPTIDKERHYNVAQLLCDFLLVARDNQKNSMDKNESDPLLNTMEMPETVSLLLDNTLSEPKTESCIVGGIQIILTLLDVNKNFDNTEEASNFTEHRQAVVQTTVDAILKRLKDFHDLLLHPPYQGPINTTIGVLDPPFGNTRLHVTKLFAAIISANNIEAIREIISLDTLQTLLDLFFKYPWNNFLHTQVEACITSALKLYIPSETGEDNALHKHLLLNCKLVQRIIDTWKENDVQQSENNRPRQGYMGHLTNIANEIVEVCSISSLGLFFKENLPDEYETFMKFKESTLEEVNKTRAFLLGDENPNTWQEDSDEFDESVPFPITNFAHQAYTQYQIQHVTPQYIESYGFNDNEFNYGDDGLQVVDHRTGMNFDLSEGDLVHQQELFKQVCSQNINTMDDGDEQIFDHRENSFQTVIEKTERNDGAYSSGSDDDSPPAEDPFLDAYLWSNKESESALAPISCEDPWSTPQKEATEANLEWANFGPPPFANFEANFEANTADTTATPDDGVDVKKMEDQLAETRVTNHESVESVAQNVETAVPDHEQKETASNKNQSTENVTDSEPKVTEKGENETGLPVNTVESKHDQEGI